MIILSHRGYWKYVSEKNTRSSFERSFELGFGTETDIRDNGGKLVVSHEMANDSAMQIEEFLDIYRSFGKRLHLALNIKADGLQTELKRLLCDYEVENYFVFDMAVPDGLLYARQKFVTFTRHSDFEPTPSYYDLAQGIWLDEFMSHWITDSVIEEHLKARKSICIVSPELHNRDNSAEWKHYQELERKIGHDRLMLCTDFPELAQEFFNE
jgi:glycerophosphoryl diester phosphodiesterase